MNDEPETVDDLLSEALLLEEQSVAMPAEIFSLARRFADHPEREHVHDVMVDVLTDSENPFVRRIAYTGVRFAKEWHATSCLDDFVLLGLGDASGWVVHDAVWLAQDMQVDTPQVRIALESVAEGTHRHFDGGSPGWVKARERALATLGR